MLSILRLLSRTCGKKQLKMRKVALSQASFSCRAASHNASRAYRYPHLSEWVIVTQGVTFHMPAHCSGNRTLIPFIKPLAHVFDTKSSVSLSLVP